MIYRSNLTAPDLAPKFKHLVSRPMPHSFGHDVPSDWGDKADDDPVFGLYKRCGLWTHDEAAILHNVAKDRGGMWTDIGSHTGWTTAHIALATDQTALGVDPLYRLDEVKARALDNLNQCDADAALSPETSLEHFAVSDEEEDGFCIDGDHEPGKPLEDAMSARARLAETGVIIFHDFMGQPVREAVLYLMDHGFHCRVYYTPHMIACCWRGDFTPPDHVPDPVLVKTLRRHIAAMKDFDFTRCE